MTVGNVSDNSLGWWDRSTKRRHLSPVSTASHTALGFEGIQRGMFDAHKWNNGRYFGKIAYAMQTKYDGTPIAAPGFLSGENWRYPTLHQGDA